VKAEAITIGKSDAHDPLHRGGLDVDILSSGTISVGSAVTLT